MATSRQHVINIDNLSASTEKELEMLLPLTNDCCISRVPECVRQFNEHYYTPKVVSIGPIHYRKEELRTMEEYKKRYLKDFLQLGQASLQECYELVQTNETKLRNCYADPVELDSEDFVKMVLIDAVFLLMIFLFGRFDFSDMSIGRKRVFEKPTMMRDIKCDLVLLENQLPFFVIEKLCKLSNIHNNCNISSFNLNDSYPEKESIYLYEETAMITLAIKFLNSLAIIEIRNRHPPAKVAHLLALLRSCLKPRHWNPKRKPITLSYSIPSINELNQAGVKFKARANQNLFDIEFNNGVLEIPAVLVHTYTELVFRNLTAFELCNDLDLLCIDYISMMQKFTIASADAQVLIRNEIIENALPDAQAVSTLFHNLSPSFIMDSSNFGYTHVVIGLNAYYAVRWNKWKVTWIQRYFKAPWAIFSLTGAVILLILTFVQTVCSILEVI